MPIAQFPTAKHHAIVRHTSIADPNNNEIPADEVGARLRFSEARFAACLTLVYAVWVLFISLHHEAWRDEADVWLAARDMGPRELFHWLGGAGTPGLWYTLVMPHVMTKKV